MKNEFSDLKMDEGKKFELLLDCLITSITKSHAAIAFIISQLAGEDEHYKNRLMSLFESISNELRTDVISGLYETYGWLPPDILEQRNQQGG